MPSEAEIFAHAKTVIRTLPRLAYQNSLQNAKTALRFAKVEFRPPSIAEISKATTTFTKIMDPQVFSKRLPNLTVGVAEDMKVAFLNGQKLFQPSEYLNKQRIMSFFSRTTKIRRQNQMNAAKPCQNVSNSCVDDTTVEDLSDGEDEIYANDYQEVEQILQQEAVRLTSEISHETSEIAASVKEGVVLVITPMEEMTPYYLMKACGSARVLETDFQNKSYGTVHVAGSEVVDGHYFEVRKDCYYLDENHIATVDMRSVVAISPPLLEKGERTIKGKTTMTYIVPPEVHEGFLRILAE